MAILIFLKYLPFPLRNLRGMHILTNQRYILPATIFFARRTQFLLLVSYICKCALLQAAVIAARKLEREACTFTPQLTTRAKVARSRSARELSLGDSVLRAAKMVSDQPYHTTTVFLHYQQCQSRRESFAAENFGVSTYSMTNVHERYLLLRQCTGVQHLKPQYHKVLRRTTFTSSRAIGLPAKESKYCGIIRRKACCYRFDVRVMLETIAPPRASFYTIEIDARPPPQPPAERSLTPYGKFLLVCLARQSLCSVREIGIR